MTPGDQDHVEYWRERKPARFVRIFKPRFAPLVANGKKLQTVRPIPARRPQVGDILDARAWEELPYRSKQRKLGEWPISAVGEVSIFRDIDGMVRVEVDGINYSTENFARWDGFINADDMSQWFEQNHGLPFNGILLTWKSASSAKSAEKKARK